MVRERALLCVAVLLGCAERDAEDPSFAMFRTRVAPVLEQRCGAGCHGTPDLDARRATEPEGAFLFPIDPRTGRIPPDGLRAAFDSARDPHHRLEPGADPAFSPIVRKPLSESLGGLPHRGIDVFATPDDRDLRTLTAWVALETQGAAPEAGDVAAFREEALGVLVRNGCFMQACHGPDAFNDLKLTPPLPRADAPMRPGAGFSPRLLAHDRAQALGAVTRFANLGGDLGLSRIVAKTLPISEGGVLHRGGNGQFLESLDDPDARRLVRWLGAERAALRLTSGGGSIAADALGRLRGIAYVRGPRHAPRRFFDVEPFHGGGEVVVQPLDGNPVSVTAALGPVEVLGLDVRYDARALVFAARSSADAPFRLYEVALDDDLVPGPPRQVSDGPERLADGTLIHHVDPLYAPGPGAESALDDVAIVYASNAAGVWASTAARALIGEADGGTARTIVDAQRTEAPGTLAGRRLAIVAGPFAGEERTIVAHLADPDSVVGARLELDAPLPDAPDRRTVYVVEDASNRLAPAYDVWRLVPGRPARRMTFGSAQDRRPTMRTSGEVMFTSVRDSGDQADRPVFAGAIYRVMSGGFDYHIHGNNRSRYPVVADSRETPQGLEVRMALDPRNLWGGGLLLLADHGFGPDVEPDNPVDDLPLGPDDKPASSSPRFLPAQFTFFAETGPDAVTVTGRSPGGAWRDPYPLPDGTVLAAHAAGPIDHLDPDADPDWDVYRLRFEGAVEAGRRTGPFTRERLAGSAAFAEHTPRPIVVRLKERAHTEQKFVAGTKTRREDGVLRAAPDAPAVVECYDYPLLQSFLTHFAPVGPRDFAESRLHAVRVIAHDPPRGPDDAAGAGLHGREWIVAEVPLEPDGSFQVQVPPETPLDLQALDADGRALHRTNRWFYVQPGEKLTFSIPRSVFPLRCGGCHGALTGERTQAIGPPDVVTSASQVMANWDATAARRLPPARQAPVAVDFRRDVQPVLDRACVACHEDLRDAPGARFSAPYERLLPLVNEREALSSESALFEKLRGHAAPAAEDLRTLARWIDLGAPFHGARPPVSP